MKRITIVCAVAGSVLFAAVGCSSQNDSYTLYRNSLTGAGMRIHIATFDTAEGEGYNRENCDVARGLFQAQPEVATKFWCEKGPFRK